MESYSIDWDRRDVMIGVLHRQAQLEANLTFRFYHMPASLLACEPGAIRHIALYQSKRLFGEASAGIRHYGEVECWEKLPRHEIAEYPSQRNPEELYYRFAIREWKRLPRAIQAVGLFPGMSMFTCLGLLMKSGYFPELYIRTEEHWKLYRTLRTASARTAKNGGSEQIPTCNGNRVMVAGSTIGVYTPDGRYEQHSLRGFLYQPHSFLTEMQRLISEPEKWGSAPDPA